MVGGSFPGVIFAAIDNNGNCRWRPLGTSGDGTTTSGGTATASTTSDIGGGGGGGGDRQRQAAGTCGHAVCWRVRANPFAALLHSSCVKVCPFVSLHRPARRAPMLQEHAAGVVSGIETVCAVASAVAAGQVRAFSCVLRSMCCLCSPPPMLPRAPVRQGGEPGAVNVDKAGPDGGLDARWRCR